MPGTFTCPVDDCEFSGTLSTVAKHVEETSGTNHSWASLGFKDSAAFKRRSQAERDATNSGDGLEPCPLTELYEAFRGVHTALLMAIRSENSSVYDEDLSEPIVQYEQVLASFLGTTQTGSDEIHGYGSQHVERVDHKVADYREHYGNGEWITDYRSIEVEPLRESSRETLSSHDLVESPSLLVRPITPQTGIPVPEIVLSEKDLSRGLSILSRFPYKPPIEQNHQTSSSRFPVEEVYQAILAGTDIEPVEFDHGGKESSHRPSEANTGKQEWRSSPAALASPETKSEVMTYLSRYGKLTHIYHLIEPPEDLQMIEPIPVFALDYYDPIERIQNPSPHSFRIISYAKRCEDEFRSYFLNRVRDFIYQRLLKDKIKYDYITVYPGHEANSLSSSLVELAKQATLETPIEYTELLQRKVTTKKQREQDSESRWDIARNPQSTLQVSQKLSNDRVIILDDVSTSGGSLAAGARLLREAGADEVIGLVLGLSRSGVTEKTQEIKSREVRASDIYK